MMNGKFRLAEDIVNDFDNINLNKVKWSWLSSIIVVPIHVQNLVHDIKRITDNNAELKPDVSLRRLCPFLFLLLSFHTFANKLA